MRLCETIRSCITIRIKSRSLVKMEDTVLFIERNVTITKTFKHDKKARKESTRKHRRNYQP